MSEVFYVRANVRGGIRSVMLMTVLLYHILLLKQGAVVLVMGSHKHLRQVIISV